MNDLIIREPKENETQEIHQLLLELAEFEKISSTVIANQESTHNALFSNKPSAHCLIALLDNEIVGVAIYFFNYSTFIGRRGLYLEDIYIREKYRGKGIGSKMMVSLAEIANKSNCGRMEWTVLDWNNKAISFYENIGAEILEDWKIVRMNKDSICKLSNRNNLTVT